MTLSRYLFFFFLGVVVSISTTCAEFQKFRTPSKNDGTLSFLVIGDWGRKGEYNQSAVAAQMGRVGDELDIDFVVSTGDNFYDNGLTGVNDTNFEESFTNVYTDDSLQKQWYSVLGNHDYRGDVEAQLDPVLRRIDSRWLCLRSFVVDAEIAELFFVDTTPFVDQYFAIPNEHTYDWKGVQPRQKYISLVLKDLDAALKSSHAKWKIVVGHHAIKSAGHHGDTNELLTLLLPILQLHDVDFYMNGHDHCLEHITIKDSRIQFLTSGAGSKAWRGDAKGWNGDGVHLFYDGQGFMSMQLDQLKAEFAFYDVDGKILHNWNVTKPLHSAI